MQLVGEPVIAALGPKPRTTKPAPGHKIYADLLHALTVERPNQVRAADITYVLVSGGFLVAIMHWASRSVLARRLSRSREVSFCGAALEEAPARFGWPETAIG